MKDMNYISSILTSKVYDVAVVTPVDEAPARRRAGEGPTSSRRAFRRALDEIGYVYREVTDNPACRDFVG